MKKLFEIPNIEKPKNEPLTESHDIVKEEGMEREIDPELLKSIEEEIEKEKKETKKSLSLFPEKLKRPLATALLGITVFAGSTFGFAKKAEAGQRSIIGTEMQRGVGEAIRNIFRGIGESGRSMGRLPGQSTERAVRNAQDLARDDARMLQRARERGIHIQQREVELMRNQIRDTLKKYDRNKQIFQDDFRRGKITEQQYYTLLKIAENDYDDQIKKIYEQYGLGSETESPQNNPANPAVNPENPQGSEKSGWDKSRENVTYEDRNPAQ